MTNDNAVGKIGATIALNLTQSKKLTAGLQAATRAVKKFGKAVAEC